MDPDLGSLPIERKALRELSPAAYNPRVISEEALAGLSGSIDRFGLVEPIVWNRRTGNVVGGHQRLKVLRERGASETDVVVVDLDEKEEKALNLALNSGQISGAWTPEALGLIDELKVELPDLSELLRMPDLRDEIATLFPLDPPALEDPPAPEPPVEPVTKRGDLWLLGEHRLLCGDATDASHVARLFADHAPFLMVTDPPYGVDYDPSWRPSAGLGEGANVRKGKVTNDDRVDWTAAFKLFTGDVAYVWHGGTHSGEVMAHLAQAELLIRAQIIWAKDGFAISRGAYHWGHEPCWYAVRKGKTARWCGDRTQSTVWQIKRVRRANEDEDQITGHGTQKPVDCMGRPIQNHGLAGDWIYDPFVGSGTTLVASEQLDRRCLAMEIDPAYCDVVVERFKALTGQEARRETSP